VEAAIALCALAAVFGLMLAGVVAVTSQLRCVDAAREAARLIARGDSDLAREAVNRIGPRGASLRTAINGDQIEVEVSVDSALPGLTVGSKAFAVAEPVEAG
jgi:hypothetical protein